VLAEGLDHRAATILMGDIAVHEEDWDIALRWTERAFHLAPDDLDAHEDRVDALVGSERWREAAAAAGRGLAVAAREDDAAHARLRLERARCLTELGDFAGAEVDIDVVAGEKARRRVAAARALRAESLLRQERWGSARTEATDALGAGPPTWPASMLTAVAWEAAVRMGEVGAAPVPSEQHVRMLRWNGRGAWMDRLVELGLEPASSSLTHRQADLRRRQIGGLTRL
jgi:hypothetical protein